jgi:hypothetical protein
VTGTYVSGRPPWTRTRCPPAPAGWGPCRKRGVSAAAEGCVRPSCEGPQATLLLSWTAEPSEMSQFTISSGSHLPVLRATGFSLPAFPLRARARPVRTGVVGGCTVPAAPRQPSTAAAGCCTWGVQGCIAGAHEGRRLSSPLSYPPPAAFALTMPKAHCPT